MSQSDAIQDTAVAYRNDRVCEHGTPCYCSGHSTNLAEKLIKLAVTTRRHMTTTQKDVEDLGDGDKHAPRHTNITTMVGEVSVRIPVIIPSPWR